MFALQRDLLLCQVCDTRPNGRPHEECEQVFDPGEGGQPSAYCRKPPHFDVFVVVRSIAEFSKFFTQPAKVFFKNRLKEK